MYYLEIGLRQRTCSTTAKFVQYIIIDIFTCYVDAYAAFIELNKEDRSNFYDYQITENRVKVICERRDINDRF